MTRPARHREAWGRRAWDVAYAKAAVKPYRHPLTGEEHEVDVSLPVSALDRLNSLPDIAVHSVCAGHEATAGMQHLAELRFDVSPHLGLWLIRQIGDSRGQFSSFTSSPALTYLRGMWSVTLQCRMYDKRSNQVTWWHLAADTLERLLRRYARLVILQTPPTAGTRAKPRKKRT